jgi:hypothetical protein
MNTLLVRTSRPSPTPAGAAAYPYEAWTPLEKFLVTWAGVHWPEPLAAIWNHLDDGDYVRRCFGSIFRQCCRVDPTWIWRVVAWAPEQVLALSPFIRTVELPDFGYVIPGRIGWREWLRCASVAGAMDGDGLTAADMPRSRGTVAPAATASPPRAPDSMFDGVTP